MAKGTARRTRLAAWCARFDDEEAAVIRRIADERYEGNRSMALRWLVRRAAHVTEGNA